jgi:hypothetical protein
MTAGGGLRRRKRRLNEPPPPVASPQFSAREILGVRVTRQRRRRRRRLRVDGDSGDRSVTDRPIFRLVLAASTSAGGVRIVGMHSLILCHDFAP